MSVPTTLALHHGTVSAGTATAVAIGTVANAACVRVEIQGGSIGYLGGSGVTSSNFMALLTQGTQGRNAYYELHPDPAANAAHGVGGATFDLSKIYVIASSASTNFSVTWMARLNDG